MYHWHVENKLHWVLDVVFREDDSRVRDRIGAQNLSWMRKVSAYILRQDQSKGSMNSKMIRNCINPDNIINMLASI